MNANKLQALNTIQDNLQSINYSGINELCELIAGRDAKLNRNIRYALIKYCAKYANRKICI